MSDEPRQVNVQSGEPFRESSEQTKIPIMLGLFDVLGFSKRLEDDGLERIVELRNELIATTVKKEAARCLGGRADGTGNRYPVLFQLGVRCAYFSDTILLWVPLEKLFVAPFIAYCATFVCEAFAMEIPVRGAIALGDAVMHRPSGTLVGSPLVEAARAEHNQMWAGVVFTPSATWPPFFLEELDPKLIIEYDAPAKDGSEAHLSPIVLDWPRRWRELHGLSLTEHLREMNRSRPHGYYAPTIAFAEYLEQNANWYLVLRTN
jgi:hypothetical protein